MDMEKENETAGQEWDLPQTTQTKFDECESCSA